MKKNWNGLPLSLTKKSLLIEEIITGDKFLLCQKHFDVARRKKTSTDAFILLRANNEGTDQHPFDFMGGNKPRVLGTMVGANTPPQTNPYSQLFKMKRVFLKNSELATDTGKQLFDLCIEIVADGKIDLDEVRQLRRWLRENKANSGITAIGYLNDIMTRITADGVIDRDELLELHLAIERVVPKANRVKGVTERKKRQVEKRMRIRHDFAKIAGVSFPNDDGTERQEIIQKCSENEQLILKHDKLNSYSSHAVQLLRKTGEQLGHAPDYLGERICNRMEDGFHVTSMITTLTGGTSDWPTCGVNILLLYYQEDVSSDELNKYASKAISDRSKTHYTNQT